MSDTREGLMRFVSEYLTPMWASNAPETEIEALMSNREGRPTREALAALADVVLDAYDNELTEDERWLLDAWIFEGRSLDEIGRLINVPKPTIWRWKNSALAKLRAALENNPIVIEHLKGQQ